MAPSVDERFGFLKSAMAKKRNPPGIPGCQDAAATLVTPHASHSSTAVSAAGELARGAGLKKETVAAGELWPMQLLETFRLRERAAEEEEGRGGEGREAAEGEGRSGSVGESKGGGGGSASSNGDTASGGAAAAAAVPATPRKQTKEQLADAQAAQSSVLVAARDAAMQLACDERERSSLAAQYDKDNVVYTKKDWGKKIWRMEE